MGIIARIKALFRNKYRTTRFVAKEAVGPSAGYLPDVERLIYYGPFPTMPAGVVTWYPKGSTAEVPAFEVVYDPRVTTPERIQAFFETGGLKTSIVAA